MVTEQEDDKPHGVAAGRQAYTDRRMPTRTEVAGSKVALGRALRLARGDRAKTLELLQPPATDDDLDSGGDAA